jgi:hypothetical protein
LCEYRCITDPSPESADLGMAKLSDSLIQSLGPRKVFACGQCPCEMVACC